MAISSASTRIFKAEDPVMETDLQLLAKVNEYQQEKFDEGEKNLQSEINNWSMLANVAKDQDKQYINAKLNKLVSGINQLGGVDLSDPNNVNSLKSLGYNMYADENVMNPVLTTRKMNALQQDIYTKTNGKNAKDYDSVYGEYLTNQYSDWLNDGKQGTKFDGPTSLPQGSFDNYNKKISEALNKLTPDINEAPQNANDALNYYQVGDKFIKKERVEAAIDAVTSSQDRDLLSAHAWKGMQGVPDTYLVGLQKSSYDSKLKSLQDNYNYLQYQKSNTNDYQQKELFTSQMGELKSAMDSINKQKSSLPNLQPGQQLDKGLQKNLRDNLFNDAFKEQYANARAFEQKKTELKLNQGKATQLKLDQTAWMFGKNYDLKVKEYDLKKDELSFKNQESLLKLYGLYGANSGTLGKLGVFGPAQSAPLSIIPNKGKDDATVVSDDVINQADANYIAKANDFYTRGYNYLMSKDSTVYGKFLKKDADGNWIPKDNRSKDIANKGLESAVDMYGNIANMSIKERNGLSVSDDDLALFNSSRELSDAKLYKDQINSLTDQVFTKAGIAPPSQQNITIRFKDGTNAVVSYAKLREMKDRNDPILQDWKTKAQESNPTDLKNKELADVKSKIFKKFSDNFDSDKLKDFRKQKDEIEAKYDRGFLKNTASQLGIGGYNSVDNAISQVESYYDKSEVKDAWKDLSKNFNVYGASVGLPKMKNGKPVEQLASYLATTIREQHPDVAGGVQNDDVDLLRIYPIYDINAKSDNKVKYMAEVRYQKGSGSDKEGKDTKGDRITTVDLTDQVMRDHNSVNGGFFGNLFPSDNAQVVYGMLLNNEGKTPMDSKDGYSTALQTHSSGLLTHRYQIVAMKNGTNGVDGYRINILIPKGKDDSGVPKFQTLPVINFDDITPVSKTITNQFPANFKYVQDYMDEWFSSTEKAREFYRRHGVPYLDEQQQQQK
jgi:hypothetical protein